MIRLPDDAKPVPAGYLDSLPPLPLPPQTGDPQAAWLAGREEVHRLYGHLAKAMEDTWDKMTRKQRLVMVKRGGNPFRDIRINVPPVAAGSVIEQGVETRILPPRSFPSTSKDIYAHIRKEEAKRKEKAGIADIDNNLHRRR